MLSFFQNHVVAGIALLIGPAIAIGALILHAYALHEMGLPLEVWAAIGLGIFALGVIGVLIKWDKEHQQQLPRSNIAANIIAPKTVENGDNIPHFTRKQRLILFDNVTKMRTLMSTIIIAFTNGDRATEPPAHDIADIFNRSGIEPSLGNTRPDNPAQSGIILCIRDLNNPPTATEDLKSAFKSANISFTVAGFPKRGFAGINQNPPANHELVIWVAPKPL